MYFCACIGDLSKHFIRLSVCLWILIRCRSMYDFFSYFRRSVLLLWLLRRTYSQSISLYFPKIPSVCTTWRCFILYFYVFFVYAKKKKICHLSMSTIGKEILFAFALFGCFWCDRSWCDSKIKHVLYSHVWVHTTVLYFFFISFEVRQMCRVWMAPLTLDFVVKYFNNCNCSRQLFYRQKN